MHNKKKHGKKKHGLALAISFGLLMITAKSFSQTAAPPTQPAPGEVLRSINPLKKTKTKTGTKKITTVLVPGASDGSTPHDPADK